MIDGFTAQTYLDGLEEATGVDRNRMERELLEYAEDQERQEEDHFKKLYTEPAYFDSVTAGNPVIEENQKHSTKPNEIPFESANRGYLSHLYGRDVGPDYSALRDSHANANFGRYQVSDHEFYDLVKGQYEWQDKKQAAATELFQTTVREALEDSLSGNRVSLVDTVAKWKEKHADLVDEDKDLEYLQTAMQMRAQTRMDLEGVAPAAARVWDVLTKFTQGEGDEADLQAIGWELTRLSDKEQDQAIRYAVLASQAEGDYKLSTLDQVATNLGQAVSRSFEFLEGPTLKGKDEGLAYTYTPIDTLERQARIRRMQLERQPDSAEKTVELERLDQVGEMAHLVRKLRDTAKNGVDPIKPILPENTIAGTAERGVYSLAGSVGYMAAAGINPMLGTLAYAQDEYNSMRLANPDMDPNVAGGAALVSGTIQSFIDRWQLRTLAGRLPFTSQFLTNMKRGVLSTAANIGRGIIAENIQEGIQDVVSKAIPTLLANLREDMPDVDVGEVMKDWIKERPTVFFATLPLGLIAGGAATFQDFKQAGMTDTELTRFGFGKAQRETIMTARDPDAAIRTEAPLRKQADIEKGIAMVEKDIKAAEKLQADPEMPTLEKVTLPDGTPEWHVRRNEGTVAPAEKRAVLTEADLAGKSVEITYVSPTDGSIQSVVKDATEAHAEVMKKEDTYSKLIDCLTR